MDGTIRLVRDGAVAQIRFARPERMNAVDIPTAHAFLAAVRSVAAQPAIRAVVIAGEGRTFGVGGDLSVLDGDPAARAPALLNPMHEALGLMGELPVPFIAAVHGMVAGGSFSVAMACDVVLATQDARFNLSYVNVGASCDGGATWTLPRLVGMREALAIALLGETMDVTEARRLGLVQVVVDEDRADARALAVAQQLAAGPTQAIGRMKRLIRTSHSRSFREQLDAERDAFVDNAASHDFAEGISAFLRKEKPRFEGR